MLIVGIDPGNVQSAYAVFNVTKCQVNEAGILPNLEFKRLLDTKARYQVFGPTKFALEKVASYGMAVGETVFETVFWSGRFVEAIQAAGHDTHRITRMEVKMNLCHNSRAKDANIRQALIDRFGPVGTKTKPGPLFGMAADKWAALAVAVTYADKMGGN